MSFFDGVSISSNFINDFDVLGSKLGDGNIIFTKLIISFINAYSDNLCLYFNPKIERENSFNLMSEPLYKYSFSSIIHSSDSSRSSE